jgi:spore maturation protein CgeB
MKTILMVNGDDATEPSFGYRCKKAFENQGYKVHNFNFRQLQLHRLSLGKNFLGQQLLRTAINLNPDLLFVNKGESIPEKIIERISDNKIKTANWCLDDPFGEYFSFNNIKNRNEYDDFFVFDPYYVPKLKEAGQPNAHYLPCAVDPKFHKEMIPFKKRKYQCDLSFIGSHQKNRQEFLENLSEYNMKIWGYRWSEISKESPIYNNIQKEVYQANKTVKDSLETCKLFNQSKINLNVHFNHSKEGLNLRAFEIPASKSFQLCDYLKEAEKLFRIDKEIVCYKDIGELKEKISYYLENEEERNKISQAGYSRVIKEHTFDERMKKVLAISKV